MYPLKESLNNPTAYKGVERFEEKNEYYGNIRIAFKRIPAGYHYKFIVDLLVDRPSYHILYMTLVSNWNIDSFKFNYDRRHTMIAPPKRGFPYNLAIELTSTYYHSRQIIIKRVNDRRPPDNVYVQIF